MVAETSHCDWMWDLSVTMQAILKESTVLIMTDQNEAIGQHLTHECLNIMQNPQDKCGKQNGR
jgi:hypothetical protein